jgi:hypothetical protein
MKKTLIYFIGMSQIITTMLRIITTAFSIWLSLLAIAVFSFAWWDFPIVKDVMSISTQNWFSVSDFFKVISIILFLGHCFFAAKFIKYIWKLGLWNKFDRFIQEFFTQLATVTKQKIVSSAINTSNTIEEITDGLKYKKNKVAPEIENEWYAVALSEIEDKDYEKGLWSKALISSGGDEHKQKAAYIKLRVEQLGASYNLDFDD